MIFQRWKSSGISQLGQTAESITFPKLVTGISEKKNTGSNNISTQEEWITFYMICDMIIQRLFPRVQLKSEPKLFYKHRVAVGLTTAYRGKCHRK